MKCPYEKCIEDYVLEIQIGELRKLTINQIQDQ